MKIHFKNSAQKMFYSALLLGCLACSDRSTTTNPTITTIVNSLKDANPKILFGAHVRGFEINPSIATITK